MTVSMRTAPFSTVMRSTTTEKLLALFECHGIQPFGHPAAEPP